MSRLDRRALFTSGAAAALLTATGVSLQAAPRRGGRLRLAVPRADARFDAAMRGAVYDTLTEVGPDGLLRGELATEWTSADNGRHWSLTLRSDARFHDGRPFAAEDAALSLAAHAFPVAEIDTPTPDTLWLRLEAPNPHLPYLLADPGLVMLPGGAVGDIPNGTGLYQTDIYRPDRHFVGHRVQPHFKDGQAGWFDSVEVAVIPDPVVRAEAVRDGFVDVADLPSRDALGDTSAMILGPKTDAMEFAARDGMGVPGQIGNRAPLDDGRIAQRWWMT